VGRLCAFAALWAPNTAALRWFVAGPVITVVVIVG
jgi:hypothetical protein